VVGQEKHHFVALVSLFPVLFCLVSAIVGSRYNAVMYYFGASFARDWCLHDVWPSLLCLNSRKRVA